MFSTKRALIFFIWFWCLPLFNGQVKAGKPSGNYLKGWNLLIRGGAAGMLTEVGPNLNLLDNEFTHHYGPALGLGLSRPLSPHWELGIDIFAYRLKGSAPSPSFSANGYHASFNELADVPVHYLTSLFVGYGSIRYYLRGTDPLSVLPNYRPHGVRIDPFVEAGIGFNFFITELRYDSKPEGYSSDLIFVKGKNYVPNPAAEPQITLGGGAKIRFVNDWHLLVSLNLDLVDYDCVDAVHNYSATGERIKARGVVSRLMLGFSLPLVRKKSSYLIWGR